MGDAEGSQIRESAPLDAACSLLHLDPTALKDALASRTLRNDGARRQDGDLPSAPEIRRKLLWRARDALVKSIYSKLFDELVEQARRGVTMQRRGRRDASMTTRWRRRDRHTRSREPRRVAAMAHELYRTLRDRQAIAATSRRERQVNVALDPGVQGEDDEELLSSACWTSTASRFSTVTASSSCP